MNDEDSRRIVTARALMWERASADEQGKWLHMADETLADLDAAAHRPAQPTSYEESMRAAGHDVEAGKRFAETWRRLSRPDRRAGR